MATAFERAPKEAAKEYLVGRLKAEDVTLQAEYTISSPLFPTMPTHYDLPTILLHYVTPLRHH